MADLPAPIQDFIDTLTEGILPPAYVLVSEEGECAEWGGDLQSYGITGLQRNVQAAAHIAFLAGVLPLEGGSVFLPHVQTREGVFADVHLFRRGSGTWVLLLDATAAVRDRQDVQQRAYNSRLQTTERHGQRLSALNRQLRDLASRMQRRQEEERTRIAREIHDELGQMLTAIKMDLRWTVKHLGPMDETGYGLLSEKLTETTDLVDVAISSVQKIARDLRPPLLDNLGLVAAISHEAARYALRTGIRCEVSSAVGVPGLLPEVSIAVFRIFQEILTNVARHAGATQLVVQLTADRNWLTLVAVDDGRGITAAELRDVHSLGLLGMKERAELLNGELTLTGTPGAGTTVTARIPLAGHLQERD